MLQALPAGQRGASVINKNGVMRCDSCGVLAVKKADFKGFKLPASSCGKFPGICEEGKKGIPAQLHACPACVPKVQLFEKLQATAALPQGPLRQAIEQQKYRANIKAVKVNFS